MLIITKEKTIDFCQQALDWLLLAAVFLLPLSLAMFYEVNNVFVLYKAVGLRIIFTLATLFYLAKILLAGKITYKFNPYFFWSILSLALSGLAAMLFSDYPVLSFWGSYARAQGFLDFIFYLLFFFLLILTLKNFSQAKRLVAALLLSSFFICLYGIVQIFNLDPISWSEAFAATGRVFSTFGQPNFFGQFLIMAAPFCFFALVFMSKRFLVRALLAVLLFSQFFCLYFTMSRAAWLAAAFELAALALIALALAGKKKLAVGLLALLLLGVGLAGIGLATNRFEAAAGALTGGHAEGFSSFGRGSGGARMNYWRAALAEIKDESLKQKLLGHGQDTLFDVFARHYRPSWALDEQPNLWADRAHNLFLDIILSTGFAGLAAYLSLVLLVILSVWRFLRTAPRDQNYWLAVFCSVALTGYFVNNLFSFSDHSGFLLFYLFLGLLVFLTSAGRPGRTVKINLSGFSRWAIFAFACIFAAVIVVYYGWRPVLADHYYMNAVKNNFFDCEAMLEYNKRAVLLGGGNSPFYAEKYFTAGFGCLGVVFSKETDKLQNNLIWLIDFLSRQSDFNAAKARAEAEGQAANRFDEYYYPLAEKDFTALAQKYPSISGVYLSWAYLEKRKEDYQAEIDIAGRGLKTLPLDQLDRAIAPRRAEIRSLAADFYKIICGGYAGLKQNDELLSCYHQLISFDPYQFDAYKKIADIYRQKGDFDKALWYNKRGYSLSPGDYTWPLAIGLIYQEKGDKQAAGDYFQKALELNPQNEEVRKLIGGSSQPAE